MIPKKKRKRRTTATAITALRAAERAVEKARIAHREAFRKACAALFNQYGMRLSADGDQSAHLVIEDLIGDLKPEDLPE